MSWPCVLSLQDHLPSIPAPTWRALFPKTSIATIWCPPRCHHQLACHFKNIFWVNCTDLKSSIPADLNSNCAVSFPTVTIEWSAISRCLPRITLLKQKALSPARPEQWTCRVSFFQCHQWMVISRPTSKSNSKYPKTCPGRPQTCQAPHPSIMTKCLPFICHLPNKTLLTLKALSREIKTLTMLSLSPKYHGLVASYFEAISQV